MSEKVKAKVIRSSKRQFLCRLSSGERVDATAKGKLLKDDTIVVGDNVTLSKIAETGEFQIDEVLQSLGDDFHVIFCHLLSDFVLILSAKWSTLYLQQ